MLRRTPATLALVALSLVLVGCSGGDDGAADAGAVETTAAGAAVVSGAVTTAPVAGDAAATQPAAPDGETITVTGKIQLDAQGTNCPYIDDETRGRVYVSPTGNFEGFFQAITDGTDPDYLVELMHNGTITIAKGTVVEATGTVGGPEMRCTQGDETEISITALTPKA